MSNTPFVSTIGRASAATRVARPSRATILCSNPGRSGMRGLAKQRPQLGAGDRVRERAKTRAAKAPIDGSGQLGCIFAQQYARGNVRSLRCFEVEALVAEHHGACKIKLQFARGLQQHSRGRLAAVARDAICLPPHRGVMRTEVDACERRARCRKLRAHPRVQGEKVRFRVHAARNTRLIGHHDKRKPALDEPCACREHAFDEFEVLAPEHVTVVDVDHPIAIQKRRAAPTQNGVRYQFQSFACSSNQRIYAAVPCSTVIIGALNPAARRRVTSACVNAWYLPRNASGNATYSIAPMRTAWASPSAGSLRPARNVLTTASATSLNSCARPVPTL